MSLKNEINEQEKREGVEDVSFTVFGENPVENT